MQPAHVARKQIQNVQVPDMTIHVDRIACRTCAKEIKDCKGASRYRNFLKKKKCNIYMIPTSDYKWQTNGKQFSSKFVSNIVIIRHR